MLLKRAGNNHGKNQKKFERGGGIKKRRPWESGKVRNKKKHLKVSKTLQLY